MTVLLDSATVSVHTAVCVGVKKQFPRLAQYLLEVIKINSESFFKSSISRYPENTLLSALEICV